MKLKTVFLISLTAYGFLFSQKNLLEDKNAKWNLRLVEGAQGRIIGLENGRTVLDKQNASGEILFLNESNFALEPGKSYRVKAEFLIEEGLAGGGGESSGSLMLSMPGSKRSPYPVSTPASPGLRLGEVSLVFTAAPDENFLRIHFVFRGRGKATLTRISCDEMNQAEMIAEKNKGTLTELDAQMEVLRRVWKPQTQKSFHPGKDGLEAVVFPGGGFFCDAVNWAASEIKSLEVGWKAHDEGGFLQLDFETLEGGKTNRSFQTMSTVPDGVWHTLRFPVGEDPAWRGRVTALKLSWKSVSLPCRVGLSRVRALAEDNLVVEADRFSETGKSKIDLLRPRGQYEMNWKGGKSPGLRLEMVDRLNGVIGKVEMPAGSAGLVFAVPDLAVCAHLFISPGDSKNPGYPRIALRELPELDPPPASWQGYWIWSRRGAGPNETTVWFRRELLLPSEIVEAEALGTGDDRLSLMVNGNEFSLNSDWTSPGLVNLSSHLHPGKNEILLKVRNVGAWGGALLNLFVRTRTGESFLMSTDENWTCLEEAEGASEKTGSRETPKGISNKVVLVGKVPCAPWGTRMKYTYIGPRGNVSVTPVSSNVFQVRVLKTPAVTTDKLDVAIRLPEGKERRSQIAISPPTGEWKTGQTIHVRFTLGEQISESGGKAGLLLQSRYLDAAGAALLGEVPTAKRSPRPLAQVRITGAGERPWFWVNGKRVPPIYLDLPPAFIDAPEDQDFLIRNAHRAGMNILRIPLNLSRFWPRRGTMDFTSLDPAMESILRTSPDSFVMLATATYMPGWWLAENPGEATAFFGGEKPNPNEDFQSLASKKWLVDIAPLIQALVEHVRHSPYAGLIIGMAPVDGVTFENMWSHGRGHPGRSFADYSPAALSSYRDFLGKKYGNPESLVNAMPPDPSRLDRGTQIGLLDPEKDRDLMDYFSWRNETVAHYLEANAGLIKKSSEGSWISGSYYGYFLMFSRMHHHLQDGGHLRMNEMAGRPSLDFVFSPTMYHWRRLGMADSPMQPAEAFSSHGKLVIEELDMRTFSEPTHYESVNGKVNTVEETLGVLDRTFGMLLARGMGGHWMEMYARWFRERVILDVLKSQMDLYRALPEKPAGTTPREVCIVSDEESAFYAKNNAADGIHQLAVAELFRRLPEAGFSFRHVLLPDFLEEGRIPPHKFYIFNNALALSKEARVKIMERLAREKAQVLWLYAPGIFFPDRGPSAANLEDFLGIPFEMLSEKTALTMKVRAGALEGIQDALEIPNVVSAGPWFFPTGAYEAVLASTPDLKPAFVRWKKNGVTHFFSSLPHLPPIVLRSLARQAGVWCYSDGEDPVHAGNDFVVLHAKTGGVKKLLLSKNFQARAVLGPWRGTLQPGATFEAAAGRTYGFLIEHD